MTRSSTSSRGRAPAAALFPAGTGAFCRRRLAEIGGVLLIGLAAFMGAALITFTPGDPSLNTAAPIRPGNLPGNLMGLPGAFAADMMIQLAGAASVLPPVVLLAWGWRLTRSRRLRGLAWRLAALPLALTGTALVLAPLDPPAAWPLTAGLGGVMGDLGLTLTLKAAALTPVAGAPAWITGGLGLVSVCAFIGALGVSPGDWRAAAKMSIRAARRAWEACAAGSGRAAALIRRLRGRETVIVAPALGGEPVSGAKSRNLVASRKPGPKQGRKAAEQNQPSLFTDGGGFQRPPLSILSGQDAPRATAVDPHKLERNAAFLASVLEDFGIRGEIVKVRPGPVVTLYELEPAPGTKTSRVVGLADDVARSMSAVSVRVAVVPGRSVIGIELPNNDREMVGLRELLASETFEKSKSKLPLVLGKDIGGAPVTADLAAMPHLLIAGTTGSGKSVGMNAMIMSLLYRHGPEDCRFIMIDPKMLELSVYEGVPHLLTPVVTDPKKAVVALKWAVREMEERYKAMSQLGVRNIGNYNDRIEQAVKKGETLTRRVQTGFDAEGKPAFEEQPLPMEPLPFIVVIVDEMADLMLVAGKDVEAAIQRLAQMARAAGIHLIMATQRPSVDVITGTIKANFPTRVSFQVTSKIDSRTILGEQGAEQLLGKGDMLHMAGGGRVARVHGPFVSDEEVEAVVEHLKAQGAPEFVEEITRDEDEPGGGDGSSGGACGDELYDKAVALVAREGKASTSFVQRHLQIGYNRAARLIEKMEAEGVVSAADRVGRREVLVGAR